MPKVLMPLVNVPMIDYTIEFLAGNGVEEIYVFCRSHADLVRAHIEQSKFSQMDSLKIECIVSTGAWTEGDALREMAKLEVIKEDFILISGDVISNMDLKRVVKDHQERRKRDKRCIMTMVFKEAPPGHPSRPLHDKTMLALDLDNNNQMIWYEDGGDEDGDSPNGSKVDISLQVFKQRDVVQLRYDLMDCNIFVCSPELLDRFNDEFDYEEIRQDFLKCVIDDMLNDQLYDNKVHVYILTNQYAARIHDLRAYNAVTHDILRRWVYPIVPDGNFPSECHYQYCRGGIYREGNVHVGQGAHLGSDTVFGEGTEIGEGSSITNSVIGRNVKIGANVTIDGSFIWSNSVLEDGCTVRRAMVCGEGAKVGKGAIVCEDCILSFGTAIGEDFHLVSQSRITNSPEAGDDDDDEFELSEAELLETKAVDSALQGSKAVGEGGIGRLWQDSEKDSDDDSDDEAEAVSADLPSWTWAFPAAAEEPTSDESSSDSEADDDDKPDEEEQNPFTVEVNGTIKRVMEDGISIRNTLLEIKSSLKPAFDASAGECACAVLVSLCELLDTSSAKSQFAKEIGKWKELLAPFVMDEEVQIDMLYDLQEYCEKKGKGTHMAGIMHVLYDEDIIEEDVILRWAKQAEDEGETKYIGWVQPFLTWLRDADEEESSDED